MDGSAAPQGLGVPIYPASTPLYIRLYPINQYIIPAIEYRPIFLEHCIVVFFERTSPASSMQKPAAIHMTRNPCIRNDRVLKIKAASADTAAEALAVIVTVEIPATRQNSP